ncbi:hypothetical protein ACFL0Y_01880, partial [Patescibacteria group bacterium]
WSHVGVTGNQSKVQGEITTADSQLSNRGLNLSKIFGYPMGSTNAWAQNYLASLGYKLAFTTQSGSTLCKQKRMSLPRIRIGDSIISTYGF